MATSILLNLTDLKKYAEGDRSRTYAGITVLDPESKVTYEDDEYELFRSPTDPNKKFTLEDAFAMQLESL